MFDRICTTGKTHIDQDLRTLAQRLSSLGEPFLTRLHGHQHLQRRDNRIAGSGVLEADDMPGVFTPYCPVTLQQLGNDVTVTDIGPHERNLQLGARQLQTQVAHQRTDHTTLQRAALLQVTSNDEQQLVTVDNGPRVIDHQYAITVTIKGNTQVSLLSQDSRLQLPHMGRAAVIIDVQAIGLRGEHHHLGAQLAKDAWSNLVHRTVRTIDNDLQAGKTGTGRHTAFAEFDVATRRVVDSRHLADLARLDNRHRRRIKQFFDHQFDVIRQLGALPGEKLDAVVIMRVMGRTDHDAGLGMKGTGQIGNCRRRHRPQQHHIRTRGGKPSFERRLEHIPGNARVLANQNLANAHFPERHASSPAELKHEVRSNRVGADPTTNTVGAKIFLSHKCSIILIRLIQQQ
ncbi:hypothetical protein D3C84_439630 [compost metagenome]